MGILRRRRLRKSRMAEDALKISLSPAEKSESSQEVSLGEQIQRITQERGPFASINEESLEKEIENSKAQTPEKEETAEETNNFEQKRASLSNKIRNALNESALSLDFVSLLVSGLRPQAGASSMSPMLKQQIPVGTISGDTIVSDTTTPVDAQSQPGTGWKLLAFENASNQLEDALARLEKTNIKEQAFWEQVHNLVSRGEVVYKSKKSTTASNLRVKYGYGDCGSTYFDKGIGVIDSSSDGELIFKPRSEVSKRVVRVNVYVNDELVSQAFEKIPDTATDIDRARNFLFEDELFYFLILEARTLASYRVTLTDKSIVWQLQDKQVEIEHVDYDQAVQEGGNHSTFASILCDLLHLLLCHSQAENLRKSQLPPPPLDSEPVEPHNPEIMRPILAHAHHSIAEARVLKLVEMMFSGQVQPLTTKDKNSDPYKILLAKPHSEFRLKNSVTLTVKSPLDGAAFQVKTSSTSATFYDLNELELWLRSTITHNS